MRLLLALAAALVVSTQLTAPVAEACGGIVDRPPAMFLVASHHGRTFVLLGGAIPETATLAWKGDDRSYDRTQVSVAPALPAAFELTLAGPRPGRTLSSKQQVFITPVFESRRAMTALEIVPLRDEAPRIAVAGKHVTSWIEAERGEVSREVLAWAQKPGFSPPLDARFLTVTRIPGADLELITGYSTRGDGPATYTRVKGGAASGGYRGWPIGMIEVDGARYVVFVEDGRVTPVRV